MAALPRVEITAAAAKRIRNYDAWVLRSELVQHPPDLAPGDVVEVVDHRQQFVAYAFSGSHRQIALRILSLSVDEPLSRDLLERRMKRAVAARRHLSGTTARRLVFSEADALPGLIVDQYADYLVVQFRTAGVDRLRSTVLELLNALLKPRGILERSDKEFRDDEGLPPVRQILSGSVPERILIEEDRVPFWVDPHHGLKTGFYLDQRPTRRRLRALIEPNQEVLDTFSYTGSLGILAALSGARVISVEQEERYVQLAKDNAALNHVEDRIRFVTGDAFYWLKMEADARRNADWVFLDPPALTKTRSGTLQARQALHHLVACGLTALRPGGGLLLSLCTYHLLDLAEEIMRIAASQLRLPLLVKDQWLQADDHPWVLQFAASRYLMTWSVSRGEPPEA